MSTPTTIAVDAMGGDRAPEAIVSGSLAAVEACGDLTVCLVGRLEAIRPFLPDPHPERVELVEASEVVEMDEHPGKALRRKQDSSIAVCARMMNDGQAQGLVSAGNTGAVVAASVLSSRLLPGVHRPGIAVAFPNTRGGITVLCETGANINMKPVHYLQYAVMAAAYAEHVLGIAGPRVGLLNVGTEESKGGDELRTVRQLLEGAGKQGLIQFVGAVEGNHIFEGAADVVVCDGFVGNTILKAAEGAARVIVDFYQGYGRDQGVEDNEVFQGGLDRLREFTDYSTYGGAPLLGIDGCAIIAHGRSNAQAIKHAVQVARDYTQRQVNQHIAQRLGELATEGVA